MPNKKKTVKKVKEKDNTNLIEKQSTLNPDTANEEAEIEEKETTGESDIKKDDNKIIDKKWIIMFFILVGIISFVSYEVLKSSDVFDYKGLRFAIEKNGQLTFYHYFYFFNDELGQKFKYNLYLQNDPRKNKVPIEGSIEYPKGYTVYISINETGLRECDKTNLAIHTLSSFLRDNRISVAPATPDAELALERNITLANCSSFIDNTVIMIQKGDETSVKKEGNCHIISDSNCEILLAVEKFMVESIIEAKNRTATV